MLPRGSGRPRWLVPVAVVGGILLLVVLPLIGMYNGLVDKETAVDNSFADLDTQLQRRHDLIPNLVNAVRGAMEQEEEVFGAIAEARTRYDNADGDDERVQAAEQESSALSRLLVVMENYPQLQSIQTVRDLQTQIEGTENRIAQSRRDYNGVVSDYNRTIRRFPRSIFAGIFGFERRDLFEADAGAEDAPTVDLEDDGE